MMPKFEARDVRGSDSARGMSLDDFHNCKVMWF